MCNFCIDPSKQDVCVDDYEGFRAYCKLHGHSKQHTYEEYVDAYFGEYTIVEEFMLAYRPDTPEDLLQYIDILVYMEDEGLYMIDGYVFRTNV
jgi:hypothetical protein